MRLFLDTSVLLAASHSPAGDLHSFPLGPTVLHIGYPAGQGDDPRNVAFADLRIWTTANQAPGSLVLANNFENQTLQSLVGPNGTYVSGVFVPGGGPANGFALVTAVPEAGTWYAGLAGVVGVCAVCLGGCRARRRA